MFYIKENEKIVLFDNNRQKLENTVGLMPHYCGLEILETDEEQTIVNFELVSMQQAKANELNEIKQKKLAEALQMAYEYENKTGFITFEGRPVDGSASQILSVELFNQSKFFQLVIGFAQGLIENDFVYSTKEDVNVFINAQEAQAVYYAITEALSKLWTVEYPAYKTLISACESIDEVDLIQIDYDKAGEEQ